MPSFATQAAFFVLASAAVLILLRKRSKPAQRDSEHEDTKTVQLLPATEKFAPSKEFAQVSTGEPLQGVAPILEFRLHCVDKLFELGFPSAKVDNFMRQSSTVTGQQISYNKLIGAKDFIINDIVRKASSPATAEAFVRAGPRAKLHFTPEKVNAAIVTCGGLCPGLNNMIREIVHTLFYCYNSTTVWGIRGGYEGFYADHLPPIRLDPAAVADIHHQGGTLLASSRGGFDLEKTLEFLISHKIDMLFAIGGDGTHRGANEIAKACIERGLNISIAGVPKTIDNDVDLIDKSFGFITAVEAAQVAIRSAKTEARCNLPNGIGIVKLMGRSAGFIALHAALSSGDVDLCLIPEVPIVLHGPQGCLPHLKQRVAEQGHAVVVVAEGAGEELLGSSAETDASGNKKLPPIGEWLKLQITQYFKHENMPATVKYIDPSYIIRSVPANSNDALYCMLLGQNVVHGAMAGLTAFSVGLVNNRMVYIPISRLVDTSPRMVNAAGRTWERLLSVTRQPNTALQFDPSKSSSARTVT